MFINFGKLWLLLWFNKLVLCFDLLFDDNLCLLNWLLNWLWLFLLLCCCVIFSDLLLRLFQRLELKGICYIDHFLIVLLMVNSLLLCFCFGNLLILFLRLFMSCCRFWYYWFWLSYGLFNWLDFLNLFFRLYLFQLRLCLGFWLGLGRFNGFDRLDFLDNCNRLISNNVFKNLCGLLFNLLLICSILLTLICTRFFLTFLFDFSRLGLHFGQSRTGLLHFFFFLFNFAIVAFDRIVVLWLLGLGIVLRFDFIVVIVLLFVFTLFIFFGSHVSNFTW